MRRGIERAFDEAAGPVGKACPRCCGPVPWVEHHRRLERAPNGVWLELSARFDPRTRTHVDLALCPECGQSVGPGGRGVAQAARGGQVGSRVVLVPGGFGNVAVDRECWAGFLVAWLEVHGFSDLARGLSLRWESSPESLELWIPPLAPTRDLAVRSGHVVLFTTMQTPEITAAIVAWAGAMAW